MTITATRTDGVLRLTFSGIDAIDAVNAEAVKDDALRKVGASAELVVDLQRMPMRRSQFGGIAPLGAVIASETPVEIEERTCELPPRVEQHLDELVGGDRGLLEQT